MSIVQHLEGFYCALLTPPPFASSCQAEKKRQTYGGQLVDRAVNAVFAAFICHTQELREEMIPFGMYSVTIVTVR